MLHFVTYYMKQDKSRKQALESAQYGLEISFKMSKLTKKCMASGRCVGQRPDGHTFLC